MVAVVTGSGGLIGSASVARFAATHDLVVGIDNDMRQVFFGPDASTKPVVDALRNEFPNYRHHSIDIRDADAIDAVFRDHSTDIDVIVHAAAQPSHDWAARDPRTDFGVNASGTLNLLESTRRHAPDAVFIFLSTNKVYGDRPNELPLVETETRWELAGDHEWAGVGIPESMSIDQCLHSLFGASKVAADVLVQEYGRYFGLKTACFRGGCLTGPDHAGAELHGFLAYLVKCVVTGRPYTVFGYEAKQVRDNIHAQDLVSAFEAFIAAPRSGEVYNIGGGPDINCSMLEAIGLAERLSGNTLEWSYDPTNRIGDHRWYVSDLSRFRSHYPDWKMAYDLETIVQEIVDAQ